MLHSLDEPPEEAVERKHLVLSTQGAQGLDTALLEARDANRLGPGKAQKEQAVAVHRARRGRFGSSTSTRVCGRYFLRNPAQVEPAGSPPTIATSVVNVSVAQWIVSCSTARS